MHDPIPPSGATGRTRINLRRIDGPRFLGLRIVVRHIKSDRRRHLRRLGLALSLLLTGLSTAGAESIESLVERAVAVSDQLVAAIEAVDEASANLKPGLLIDGSRLSVSSSIAYRDTSDGGSFSEQASASLSVPIIPQISLSSGISTDFDDLSASFGLSISPFASGSANYQTRQSYESAAVDLISLTAGLPHTLESALFSVAAAESNLELSVARMALEERTLEAKRARYEVGEINFAALQSASNSLYSAQRSRIDAERTLLQVRNDLISLVDFDIGSSEIEAPSIEALEDELEKRKTTIDAASMSPRSANELERMVSLRGLEGRLAETPRFDPDLSISADSGLPFASVTARVSFSLSSDRFRGDERDEIRDLIEDAESNLEAARRTFEIELEMLDRRIRSNEAIYASSISSVETAELGYEEARYLSQLDEIDPLDLESSRLSVVSARQSRYSQAVSLLAVYAEYLEYLDIAALSAELF